MGNMSYCRFENTLADLRDCYDHWDEPDLSDTEARCRKKLAEICQEIAATAEDQGLISGEED